MSMATVAVHPLIEARRDQMFPVLEPAEVGRLWRFGELKSYAAGERVVTRRAKSRQAHSSFWQAGSMSATSAVSAFSMWERAGP